MSQAWLQEQLSAGAVSSGGGFGLRFGAAGSVGTSCLGLFLLPGGLPRRFGAGAASCAACGAAWHSVHLLLYVVKITRTTKTTREAGRRCRPGRSGGSACASGVTGPLRAMKCPSSGPVSTMVPTPLFIQHSAGVGQLGAAQVDLVARHHPDELKDLLPAGDKARAQHVVHAEGLGGRGGRRSRVVCGIREFLAQLQVVQDEPVAVIGNAQTVCGLAIGGGGKVGTRPWATTPSSACPARRQPSRGSGPCRPGGSCRRRAAHRSASAGTLPGLPGHSLLGWAAVLLSTTPSCGE